MDLGFETRYEELFRCLKSAGVKDETLNALVEDELDTVEVLDSTSDSLLKQCGIKVGQIIRLRDGLKKCKEKQQELGESSLEAPEFNSTLIPSSPVPIPPSPTVSLPSSPFSMPSNHENVEPYIYTFAEITKDSKSDAKWLQTFELPKRFSASVSQALRAKKLSSNERNDFTRDVVTSMMAHTSYPTKQEREHIAFMIIKSYPFLADKLGTGIGSWEQAIKNRFKNKRKNKPQGVKRLPAQHTEAVKPKKVKAMDVGKIPEIAESETVETCKEHALAMKKELSKTTNRNINMVRQLMEITFPVRRAKILKESMSVEDILKEYPGLQLVSEFKFEFGRILCDKNLFKTMADNFKEVLKPKILKLAKTKMSSNNLFIEMEEALADNIDKKSEIEGATAIILLPKLMSSKGTGELLKMCLDDDSIDAIIEDTVAPKLIGGGHVGDIVPLYLAVEGKVVLKLNSGMPVSQALVLLIACYYIFNIEYASNLKNVFLALEATIMGRMEEAKKRVSVNKFLQELN